MCKSTECQKSRRGCREPAMAQPELGPPPGPAGPSPGEAKSLGGGPPWALAVHWNSARLRGPTSTKSPLSEKLLTESGISAREVELVPWRPGPGLAIAPPHSPSPFSRPPLFLLFLFRGGAEVPGSRGGAGEEARRPGADTSPTSPCRRGGLQLLLSVAASLAAPLPFREGMTKKNFVFGLLQC